MKPRGPGSGEWPGSRHAHGFLFDFHAVVRSSRASNRPGLRVAGLLHLVAPPVGTQGDDTPFTSLRTRQRPGAVLADVKIFALETERSTYAGSCVGHGGESILDVSEVWAVTATGKRVSATGVG